MAPVHRHGDARSCDATTVVSINTNVFANEKLIAVHGNFNTHGSGPLVAGSKNVFIKGIAVVNHTPDNGLADSAGHNPTPTAAGSANVNVGD